jgi:LDH2 family malate/lactate/ureidoglycolate dehydrogenase
MQHVRVNPAELLRFATDIFSAQGMSRADAETAAEVLVWANERGVDSHGVMRIPVYLAEMRTGEYNTAGQPVIRQLLPSTFILDCNRAPGPVCMMRAAARATELAETFGVGIGLVSDPTHVGAIGRYAQWVAERGHAALVIVAGLPLMAYHGAKVASIATAPIAIAVPAATAGTPPVLLDMATSLMPFGRVQQAAAEGTSIPAGVAVDAEGKATTDPSRATTLLPLGGAKGSGLSFMFECLTGILAGTPIIAQRGRGYSAPRQNAMIAVFNIASFRPLNNYREDIQELAGFVKELPRREGFDELLLPGERGDRETELRRRTGIPLSGSLWTELNTIARELGVAPIQTL